MLFRSALRALSAMAGNVPPLPLGTMLGGGRGLPPAPMGGGPFGRGPPGGVGGGGGGGPLRSLGQPHQTGLPPNLLAFFVPREPLEHAPAIKKRKCPPYTGERAGGGGAAGKADGVPLRRRRSPGPAPAAAWKKPS